MRVTKNSLWTILGVIAAIVIGWILVNVLFSVVAFIVKLVLVAIVALVVFFILRSVFARRDRP